MTIINKALSATITLAFLASMTACSPEVGSDQWCNKMKEIAVEHYTWLTVCSRYRDIL